MTDPLVEKVARALNPSPGFTDDDGVRHPGLMVADVDRAEVAVHAVLAALPDDPRFIQAVCDRCGRDGMRHWYRLPAQRCAHDWATDRIRAACNAVISQEQL